MAAAVRFVRTGPASTLVYRQVEVTLDNSYPSGGYALVAADFGLKNLFLVETGHAKGYHTEYNYTTGKLMVYRNANINVAATEPTGADLSTIKVTVLALGEPL